MTGQHALYLNGIACRFLSPEQVKEKVPLININGRYPIVGALYQSRAGTARHDAVAWGYARAADQAGVDIIQNCAVTGFRINQAKSKWVETTCGFIGNKVGVVTAGHSGVLANMAGFRLPIESFRFKPWYRNPKTLY